MSKKKRSVRRRSGNLYEDDTRSRWSEYGELLDDADDTSDLDDLELYSQEPPLDVEMGYDPFTENPAWNRGGGWPRSRKRRRRDSPDEHRSGDHRWARAADYEEYGGDD